jgi:hypothetical protein
MRKIRYYNKQTIQLLIPLQVGDVMHTLAPKQRPQTQKEKPAGAAILPCQQAVYNKISRFLSKHNTRTIHIPVK